MNPTLQGTYILIAIISIILYYIELFNDVKKEVDDEQINKLGLKNKDAQKIKGKKMTIKEKIVFTPKIITKKKWHLLCYSIIILSGLYVNFNQEPITRFLNVGLMMPISDSTRATVYYGNNQMTGQNTLSIDDDVLSAWLINGKLYFSFVVRSSDGDIMAEINKNECLLNPDRVLDINYDDTAFEMLNKKGEVVLQVTYHSNYVLVLGDLYTRHGSPYIIRSDGINTGNITRLSRLFVYPSSTHLHERSK